MEQFSTEEVMEATAQIVEHAPEVELKLKAVVYLCEGVACGFWGSNTYCEGK